MKIKRKEKNKKLKLEVASWKKEVDFAFGYKKKQQQINC